MVEAKCKCLPGLMGGADKLTNTGSLLSRGAYGHERSKRVFYIIYRREKDGGRRRTRPVSRARGERGNYFVHHLHVRERNLFLLNVLLMH